MLILENYKDNQHYLILIIILLAIQDHGTQDLILHYHKYGDTFILKIIMIKQEQ
jgi:hypothetical protein